MIEQIGEELLYLENINQVKGDLMDKKLDGGMKRCRNKLRKRKKQKQSGS
jgi:hypothetical protein